MSEYALLALLGISALSLFISGVALARTYRPPQTADVQRLALHVGEVDQVVADLVERFQRRSKAESTVKARTVREQNVAERDMLAEKAREILTAQAVNAVPPTGSKADLRRRFGLIR